MKPDLTNPANGIHAINLVVYQIAEVLSQSGYPEPVIWQCSPITTPEINYDRLNIPKDSLSRSPRYTRYLDDGKMLRTHTSAIAAEIVPHYEGDNLLLMPGIVYRRDVKDKTHIGEPHQMDIWLISQEKQLGREQLIQLLDCILRGVNLDHLPRRINETNHPYTHNGIEVEVLYQGNWVEILEAGEAHPSLLPKNHSGLAMGLGLERLVMLIKEIDDIRLLYDKNIQDQMQNLDVYRRSAMPLIVRDLSIKGMADTEIEDITEAIANILADDYALVSSCELVQKTGYDELPPQAIARWDMKPNECNMLIRLTLQDNNAPIPKGTANRLRDVLLENLQITPVVL